MKKVLFTCSVDRLQNNPYFGVQVLASSQTKGLSKAEKGARLGRDAFFLGLARFGRETLKLR